MAYNIGKVIGDIASVAVGITEVGGGLSMMYTGINSAAGGVLLASTGAGIEAGIGLIIEGGAVAVGGAAVIGLGSVTAVSGMITLFGDAKDVYDSASGGAVTNGVAEIKAEDVKWKGFSSKKDPETGLTKLQSHYLKHVVEGGEFGDISQNEYLKMAKEFAKENNPSFQQKQVGNLIIKYDPETRRMFIGNLKDREIRTFYRADYRSSDPFEAAIEEAMNMVNK